MTATASLTPVPPSTPTRTATGAPAATTTFTRTPTNTPSPLPGTPTFTPTPVAGQLQVCAAASADDGYLFRLGAAYPPAGTTTVNTSAAGNEARRSRRTSGDYTVAVLLLRFNTAALPDDAVITAAHLALNVVSVQTTDGRDLVGEFYPPGNWPIDAADYTDVAPALDIAAPLPLGGLPTGPLSVDMSPALADQHVSRTGSTGLRFHISGGLPTGPNFVSLAGVDHTTLPEPCLVVDYVQP